MIHRNPAVRSTSYVPELTRSYSSSFRQGHTGTRPTSAICFRADFHASSRWSKGIAGDTGDRLDGLLADCIGAWLVSEGRITEEQNGKATTMAQVMTEYERSLEEFGSRRKREGRAELLVRLTRKRFGAEAGDRLAGLFGKPADAGRLASAEAAVIECATAEELLRRVEGSGGG